MAHISCSFLDYLTIKSLLGMGIPLMLLIWSICNGDYYTGSSQEVDMKKVSISIISILLSQLKVKCLEKLTSCFLLQFLGLEGKYIAAQICFLFCKGACSSFVWKQTWLDLITEYTHILTIPIFIFPLWISPWTPNLYIQLFTRHLHLEVHISNATN